jgi:hypothetical protein
MTDLYHFPSQSPVPPLSLSLSNHRLPPSPLVSAATFDDILITPSAPIAVIPKLCVMTPPRHHPPVTPPPLDERMKP